MKIPRLSKPRLGTHNNRLPKLGEILVALFLGLVLAGCESRPPYKSDAELGLNTQQARGRALYDTYCLRCHEAYISGGRNGPSLMGVFKKKELPSGAPANDERAAEVIMRGRAKMPAFADKLDLAQVQDILAYLHTL
jgi:mono/diheme cytochrome c family protein